MNLNYLIKPGSRDWPKQMDDLGDGAPEAIWCNGFGNLRLLALRSVAIVGCRAASAYGRAVASDLAAGLVERGWVVVSGAAFGIDAAAHRGALAAGGCTVAILPGGADVPVPRAHEQLLSSITENGLVISENEFGMEPRRHMFLIRNRLIAALTRGVVVVEADSRSGSINTAGHAERLGRMVMATPGPITGRQSRGTHELIRTRRAELVMSADDVVELLEPLGSAAPDHPPSGRGPSEVGGEFPLGEPTVGSDPPAIGISSAAGGVPTAGGPPSTENLLFLDPATVVHQGGAGSSTAVATALLALLVEEPVSVSELAGALNLTQSQALAGLDALRAQSAADLTIEGWRRSKRRGP